MLSILAWSILAWVVVRVLVVVVRVLVVAVRVLVVVRSNVERNEVSDITKKATTIVKEYDPESKFSKPKSFSKINLTFWVAAVPDCHRIGQGPMLPGT